MTKITAYCPKCGLYIEVEEIQISYRQNLIGVDYIKFKCGHEGKKSFNPKTDMFRL